MELQCTDLIINLIVFFKLCRSVLADEYHGNRAVYMEKARKCTQEHATKKSFAELKKVQCYVEVKHWFTPRAY